VRVSACTKKTYGKRIALTRKLGLGWLGQLPAASGRNLWLANYYFAHDSSGLRQAFGGSQGDVTLRYCVILTWNFPPYQFARDRPQSAEHWMLIGKWDRRACQFSGPSSVVPGIRRVNASCVDQLAPFKRGKRLDGFSYLLLGEPQVVEAL